MPKLTDKKASTTTTAILYGYPKTGKTLLAGQLAKHFNLIWLDLEHGYETLLQLPLEWQERIQVVSVPDTKDNPVAVDLLFKVTKAETKVCVEHSKIECALCKRDPNLEWDVVNVHKAGNDTILVIDSLTQLTSSVIAKVTRGSDENYKLTYDDWAAVGNLLGIILGRIQVAGYNVLCISHENEIETDGKLKTLVPVAGTRNFSKNVAKYFSHVIYAEKKNNKHAFTSSTTYRNTVVAGSRANVDVGKQNNPSLVDIFKLKGADKKQETTNATNKLNKLRTNLNK